MVYILLSAPYHFVNNTTEIQLAQIKSSNSELNSQVPFLLVNTHFKPSPSSFAPITSIGRSKVFKTTSVLIPIGMF